MVIKYQTCSFSEFKIAPGHGLRYCEVNGKTHMFISKKVHKLYKHSKKALNIRWTPKWRLAHKKGKTEETKKRIQKQIDSLLEKYYELKNKAEEIHSGRDITKGLVPARQIEINLLKSQLDEIENTRTALHSPKYNTFSWGTYGFLMFLLLGLSFYLLYFYMSVADFALNGVDPMTVFQDGRLNVQLLPNLRRRLQEI